MDAPIRFLLLLVLSCAGTGPRAGEIHACRDAHGARVFQDQPCAPGMHTLGVRPAAAGVIEPRVVDPAARRAAREEAARIAAWERRSRARLAPSLGGSAVPARAGAGKAAARPPARAASDACAGARAARERAYRGDGNRMGFDRRRALDDAVTNACGLR